MVDEINLPPPRNGFIMENYERWEALIPHTILLRRAAIPTLFEWHWNGVIRIARYAECA